jgi:hypothetical protein
MIINHVSMTFLSLKGRGLSLYVGTCKHEWDLGPWLFFHKVPNMSRDMFIKKTFSVDGFLENEPVLGRVKFTLDGF